MMGREIRQEDTTKVSRARDHSGSDSSGSSGGHKKWPEVAVLKGNRIEGIGFHYGLNYG